MQEWTQDEKLKAAEEVSTIRYGDEKEQVWRAAQVEAVLRGFDWNKEPNMTVHVSTVLNIVCERNALRDALNHLVCYMEDADSDLLIVEDARALLARIPQ